MKIQLKRSSVLDGVAAKEPTAAQMEYGELAVNYNENDPAIFIKDSTDSIIRIGGVGSISDDGQVEIPSDSNPPATPEDGNLWYNPEDGRLYVYYNDGNSSQWVDASPDGWNAAEDGASIHVGDTPPATPLEGSLWWNTTDNTLYIYYIDATSEQWVTASPSGSIDVDDFVAVAGDNMTGNLTLGTDKITLDATAGSMTFVGNSLAQNPASDPFTYFNSGGFYANSDASTQSFSLTAASGSADFAGALTGTSADFSVSVTAAQGFVGSSYTGFGTAINKATNVFNSRDNSLANYFLTTTTDGSVYIGNKTSTGPNSHTSSSNARIVLDGADGSANFTGNVVINTIDVSSNSGQGCEVRTDGLVRAQRPTGSGGSAVFQAWNGNLNSATITAGGAATFTTVNGSAFSINLEADDDTKYTSTTDIEGNETRVYNGEVLDVKDRLTKADNALKALKTAAAAAADFASLQSAIATALADI